MTPFLGPLSMYKQNWQKEIWTFFLQFHLITMPICSVFDAFWYVWVKYFILPWVAEPPLGFFSTFNLWGNSSRGSEPAKFFGKPLILGLKVHDWVIFTTYGLHFFRKSKFYSHFGDTFWELFTEDQGLKLQIPSNYVC